MGMRRAVLALIVVLGCLSTGCAERERMRDQQDAKGFLSTDEANRLNADRSPFDTAKDPKYTAQTHFAAGQYAESQERMDVAVDQYQKALKLDPNHVPSLYRLALLYTHNKEFADALKMWKRFTDATQGSAAGYSNLGFCNELAGKTTDAEKAYLSGIAKDPKSVLCRTNYGLMLARQGRVNEAKIQLLTIMSPADVHYNIASVYEQQGKKDAAKAEYREALKIEPDMGDAQRRLATIDQP